MPGPSIIGQSAALATAALWAVTSVSFAEAGKRIGSVKVNLIRLTMAVCLYATVLLLWTGHLAPPELNKAQLGWLAASGIVGLAFGDGCGFKALVIIGPRLTTLMYASAPIWATVCAWLFLGENLAASSLLGMAITLAGIFWVVRERQFRSVNTSAVNPDHPDRGSRLKGIAYGLGAAAGQGIGIVMAKHAMIGAGAPLDPFAASFLRMVAGWLVIGAFSFASGQLRATATALSNRTAVLYCAGGALAGPFFGVWMSLVAVRIIPAGLATTLNAMTPVMILPLVIWYYREKVTWRAFLGAVLAVAGVAVINLL